LVTRAISRIAIFWPNDESLEDSANLPDPDIIAAEIVEDIDSDYFDEA